MKFKQSIVLASILALGAVGFAQDVLFTALAMGPPHLVETKTGQPRTDVSATRGVLSQDGEEVFLYDNVVLEREATDARSAMRVETSELQYARSRSIARSERDVRIIEDRQVISGRGMEYDLDAERIALRERVRARVEPKKQIP